MPVELDPIVPPPEPGAIPLPARGGQWFVSVPPACRPVTADELRGHCRIGSAADSSITDDQLYLYIDAATEYAESALSACLVPRTIVAHFYDGESIDLPRGPVIAIASVVNRNNVTLTGYQVGVVGYTYRLQFPSGVTYPVVVTYTAGYTMADAVSVAIPADLKLAILMLAATYYENRESVAEKTMIAIPQTVEAFFARKRRTSGVR